MFIYYLVIIIISYYEYDVNDRKVIENIKDIDEIVKKNMKCELYKNLIHKDEYYQNIEILSKYIKRNELNINNLTEKDKIAEIGKILFTYEISTGESFFHNNIRLSLIDKDSKDICEEVSKCFFISLSNPNHNEIFSDFEILESRDVISELIKYDQNIMKELKDEYIMLKDRIHNHSANITKNKDYNNTYYKSHLIFVSLSSIYFSLLAITFFGLFEFNYLNQSINGYYLDIDSFYVRNPTIVKYCNIKYITIVIILLTMSIIIL